MARGSRSTRRLALAAAGAAALGALGLLAAGCSGSSAASSARATTAAAATTTTGGNAPPAGQAFRACLRKHGVTATFPVFGRGRRRPPTGTSRQPAPPRTSTNARRPGGGFAFRGLSAKARKAFQACRSSLPRGGFGGGRGFRPGPGRGPTSTTGNGAFAKYTRCLSQHGVKLGAGSARPATFRKAQAACRKLLPAVSG